MKRNVKSALKTLSKVTNKQFELCRFNIAGVQYGDYQDANVNTLKRGVKLNLFWERSNEIDSNAIRIETQQGVKLGYVPMRDGGYQDRLHSLREEGVKVTAELSSYNKNNPTWNMFVVKIMVNKFPKTETGEYRF